MPAFDLPKLPFPIDANGVPHITSPDGQDFRTMAASQWFKKETAPGSGVFIWVPVSETDPLPIKSYTGLKPGFRSGIKTITSTPAEIFAGASRKTDRTKLIVRNLSDVLRFRIGDNTLTQQNGFPFEPGAVYEQIFKVDTPVYIISEGGPIDVAVWEE